MLLRVGELLTLNLFPQNRRWCWGNIQLDTSRLFICEVCEDRVEYFSCSEDDLSDYFGGSCSGDGGLVPPPFQARAAGYENGHRPQAIETAQIAGVPHSIATRKSKEKKRPTPPSKWAGALGSG